MTGFLSCCVAPKSPEGDFNTLLLALIYLAVLYCYSLLSF
jgi:hypothetical protein